MTDKRLVRSEKLQLLSSDTFVRSNEHSGMINEDFVYKDFALGVLTLNVTSFILELKVKSGLCS